MRTKKVTRHYCDFCSRGNFTRDAMERHEARCFRNPRRSCEICESAEVVSVLIAALRDGGMSKLRDAANNCPACILSAIMQERKLPDSESKDWSDFDYKKEMEEWRAEQNREFAAQVGGFQC